VPSPPLPSSFVCCIPLSLLAFVSDIEIIDVHAAPCCSLAVASISCFIPSPNQRVQCSNLSPAGAARGCSSGCGAGDVKGVSEALQATTRASRLKNPGIGGSVDLENRSSTTRAVSTNLGVAGFSLTL
jgi:hypothetical protein